MADNAASHLHDPRPLPEHDPATQAQQLQKLESLDVLANGVAHSFNNLLTTIIGFASLAGMELNSASPVHPYLREIQRAAAQAADLCRQLLTYAGKVRTVLEPVDLSRLVRETTDLLRLSIPSKVELHLHLADDLPPMRADAAQLRQLIGNLVRNAVEALGEAGGRIDFRTAACELSGKDLADAQRGPDVLPGRYVVLEVRDNGCGMSAATKARIFEPFFTTKFISRGLGLAVVLGIIRSHRGAVKVESTPGAGSTFRVFLPCDQVTTAAGAQDG
jgi:two-component system cell cycle sensor histidine kinase/response regulator CckA